jgi:NAD(P)H-dependent flavin oxidoreductase YrpB (nitropropane dioxygenase family)
MWDVLPLVAGTETRRMIEGGDVDAGVLACSQSIGIVDEVRPVTEIIGDMVREAAEIRVALGE